MNTDAAIDSCLETIPYLDWRVKAAYFKAAPLSRADLERRLEKIISRVDRAYLAELESNGGRVSWDYWQRYEADLRAGIATPLRAYIEQSFTNYSDYTAFIDRAGAVDDINTAMTNAITETARGVSRNTQARLNDLLSKGLSEQEVIESIALRFSSGHAAQVAITELTRAESFFSDALAARMAEQGIETVIRWLTEEDEIVRKCPICWPADKKKRDEPINTSAGGWNGQTWGNRFGRPPAHPNCRCKTVVEYKR